MTTNQVYLDFCVPVWAAHFDVQPITFVLSCRIVNQVSTGRTTGLFKIAQRLIAYFNLGFVGYLMTVTSVSGYENNLIQLIHPPTQLRT